MDVAFNFIGKNFVVTGASSGIGRQVVLELLFAGANVCALSRHISMSEDFPEDFTARLYMADVDVNDHACLQGNIEKFTDHVGKVDGCVHCAGFVKLMPVNVWNLSAAEEMMHVNLWAGMALMKILARKKFSNEGASYIYLSSVSAQKGQKGMSVYSASKAALEAMVRCAAQEYAAKNYRVNSICLGWVETKMTEDVDHIAPDSLLGNGQPEDAAGMILFLLSRRARWITGSNFVVDGGYLS